MNCIVGLNEKENSNKIDPNGAIFSFNKEVGILTGLCGGCVRRLCPLYIPLYVIDT